jgi:hypothetical protein
MVWLRVMQTVAVLHESRLTCTERQHINLLWFGAQQSNAHGQQQPLVRNTSRSERAHQTQCVGWTRRASTGNCVIWPECGAALVLTQVWQQSDDEQ